MNTTALQQHLDSSNGPLFRDNRYLTPVRSKEPTAKYKSCGAYAR